MIAQSYWVKFSKCTNIILWLVWVRTVAAEVIQRALTFFIEPSCNLTGSSGSSRIHELLVMPRCMRYNDAQSKTFAKNIGSLKTDMHPERQTVA